MASKNILKNMNLKSYDEIFGDTPDGKKEVSLQISDLHEFKDHPFKVLDDSDMEELVCDIKQNGVITPIEVREIENGYEIISGHRRTHAAKKAGLTEIPAFISNLSDEDAILHMTAANKYRSKILPSEKAWAYRMELDALKKKRREGMSTEERTDSMLAENVGESRATIQRFIRLTKLIPPFLDMVDKGEIGVVAIQPVASLSILEQKRLLVFISETNIKLTQDMIEEICDYIKNEVDPSSLSNDDFLIALGKKVDKPKKVSCFKVQSDVLLKYCDDNSPYREKKITTADIEKYAAACLSEYFDKWFSEKIKAGDL